MNGSRFQNALKVWHGSPYDWDRPDPAKALTGEGAQVYGHGALYVAEAQDTGKTYMEQTTKKRREEATAGSWLYKGTPTRHLVSDNALPPEARHGLSNLTFDHYGPKGINNLMRHLGKVLEKNRGLPDEKPLQAQLDWLKAERHNFEHTGGPPPPGRLYELELDVGPHEILDWDARINEHHPEASKKILSLETLNELVDPDGNPLPYHNYTGSGIYHTLVSQYGSPAKASEALRQAGIHVIRYRDQFSRYDPNPRVVVKHPEKREGRAKWRVVTGQLGQNAVTHAEFDDPDEADAYLNEHKERLSRPTYNYVVFDPSRVRVLRKYGMKGQLVADLTKSEGPLILTAQPGKPEED